MSDTRVSVLTPPGTGAIATVEVTGPQAWNLARRLFRPAGTSPLPNIPELHCFWFGKLADGDEVVLAVKQVEPEPCVEVHCHGGRRVVRWVVEQFTSDAACGFATAPTAKPQAASLIPFAPTLRTASILLDQHHGAFDRALRGILADLDAGHPDRAAEPLAELARFAPVGRHLVEPWKVVIAGPPNVGKSSLVNALAGYQRSVVSAIAGTTRDVVTVSVAFDGWPVELADTAGLRDAAGLEGDGIGLAKQALAVADLVIRVVDASNPQKPQDPSPSCGIVVVNKCDLLVQWDVLAFPNALHISALTGDGVPGLAATIARHLVPHAPPPGAAVPFTHYLAALVEVAHGALTHGRPADAANALRACLGLG